MTNGRGMVECNNSIPVLKHSKCSENYFALTKLHLGDSVHKLQDGFHIPSIN